MWGLDDEDVANARQHQGGKRVIDHGLVVNGQQALANGVGDGIETRAGTSGKDDAFISRRLL